MTFLYQNHDNISAIILYFWKKYIQFSIKWCSKIRYFRLIYTKITMIYRHINIFSFKKKISQISIIMIPGYLVFSTCLFQITLVYRPMSCIFLKSASKLRYKDKKISQSITFWKLPQIYTMKIPKNKVLSTCLHQNHNSLSTWIL